MLTLIDTSIGFIVVLLMISLVIKGLTSLLKNFVDYKRNLVTRQVKEFLPRVEKEFDDWSELLAKLAREGKVHGQAQDPLVLANLAQASLESRKSAGAEEKPPVDAGAKEKPPSEAVTEAKPPARAAQDLLPYIEAFNDRVGSVVSTTNKNLSVAIGLTICLLFNINCLTVWKSLYHDANLRAQFASAAMAPTGEKTEANAAGEKTPTTLAEFQVEALKHVNSLRDKVPFAFGNIWETQEKSDEKNKEGGENKGKEKERGLRFLLYEFFGSLLTGLLASVGAPYLHDMLRILTALRRKAEAGGKGKNGQPAGDTAGF